MQVDPLGDSAITIRVGWHIDEPTRVLIRQATNALAAASLHGVVDVVPGFTTITVHYDLHRTTIEALADGVRRALSMIRETQVDAGHLVRIPVCYGGVFGPDLEEVAAHAGLSPEAIIECHIRNEYRVYVLGFLPGFAYLGGLDPRIAAPRRATPRARVPAGSVGIAGLQTGIYPLDSPGGWQVIGRSPVRMFDPSREPPTVLLPGDRVRFDAIEADAFDSAQAGIS